MPACLQGKPILEKIFSEEVPVATLDASIRAHLDTCPSCRQELEAWNQVDQALQEYRRTVLKTPVPVIQLPADRGTMNGQSDERSTTWLWVRGWVTTSLGATAAVLGLLVAIGVGIFWSGSWKSPRPDVASSAQGPTDVSGYSGLATSVREGRVLRGVIVGANHQQWRASDRFPLDGSLLTASGAVAFELPEGVTCEMVDARWQCRPAGVELHAGQGEFQVAKPRSRRFTVTVPVAVLGVRGTRFKVRIHSDQTVGVEVTEGCVEVVTIKGDKTLLHGGQGIAIAVTGELRSLARPQTVPDPRLPPTSESTLISSEQKAVEPVSQGGGTASPPLQATSTLRQALNE